MTDHGSAELTRTGRRTAIGHVPIVLAGMALVCACAQALVPALGDNGTHLALALSGFTVAIAAGAACIAAWTVRRERAAITKEIAAARELGSRNDPSLAARSHELLTPLNVLVGYAGLLLDESIGTLVPAQQDIVTRIATNARNLSGMIHDLVDVSRIEAGRVAGNVPSVEADPIDGLASR